MKNPKSRQERKVSLLPLCGLALVSGVMTGFGAVVFRILIGFVHKMSSTTES
jgi:CIC family chloride channel protein